MKTKFDFFKNVKDETILSMGIENRTIKCTGYDLLIDPDLGSWAVIEEDSKLCNELRKGVPLSSLKEKFDENILSRKLNDLFFSGLINLNGKNALEKKCTSKTHEIAPKYIVVKYTKACNLKCSYCYSYHKGISKFNIPQDFILKTLRLISESYGNDDITFVLHGGEPLLRFKEIKNLIENSKRINDNVEFTIQTNATLITKDIAYFLNKNNVSVGVSVDGYNNSSNLLRRFNNNKDSLSKTLSGINNLQNAGTNVGLISVVTNQNYKELINYIRFFVEKDINDFNFLPYFPAGRGSKKENKFAVNYNDLVKVNTDILLYINDYNTNKPKEKRIHERQLRQLIRHLTQWGKSYMCAESPCGAGRRILGLDIDGGLYPCDDLIGNKNFLIGNVDNISNVKEVLKNSDVMTKSLNHRIENIPQCSKCVWRKICVSHCLSDSFFFSGKLNSPSSKCQFYQKFIPIVIDLLYKRRIEVDNLLW
jgi:uncharacterized protein